MLYFINLSLIHISLNPRSEHLQNNQINTSLHGTLHQNTPNYLTDILHQCEKISDIHECNFVVIFGHADFAVNLSLIHI